MIVIARLWDLVLNMKLEVSSHFQWLVFQVVYRPMCQQSKRHYWQPEPSPDKCSGPPCPDHLPVCGHFHQGPPLLDFLGVSLQPQRSRWLVVAAGGCLPCVCFLCCPVLNSAAPVVQTVGGVGVCVSGPYGPGVQAHLEAHVQLLYTHPFRVWRNTLESFLPTVTTSCVASQANMSFRAYS